MTTKRGQGEGSFRKRDGRQWEYRIRVLNPETGFKERISVTGATKDECRKKAQEITRSWTKGKRVSRESASLTVSQWSEIWRTEFLPNTHRKTAGVHQYDSLLRNHIEGTSLGRIRLNRVTGLQLESHIQSRQLSVSSKRSLHSALQSMFADAVRDRRLDVDPMKDAKRPKKPAIKRATQARALSDQGVIGILEATKDHRWSAMIVLGLHTGMRRGELAGLRWSDIDFKAGEIHVQQQHTVYETDADLKTVHGDRIIPLSQTAKDALIEHGARETERLAGIKDARTDLVFTGATGNPVDLRSMSRWYTARAKEVELADTGWAALRHTFASRALAAGVPITDVSDWLGHADPSITLQHYSWALPANKTQTMDLLERHLTQIE